MNNKIVIMSTRRLASAIQMMGGKLFGRYLFITNSVICGTLMGAGDVTAQFIEKPSLKFSQLDTKRAGRYTIFGLSLGPLNHLWYLLLDKKYPHVNAKSVLRKILLDQTIAGPLMLLALFFGLGFLEQRSFKQTKEDARANFWNIYKVDLCTWPLAQVINFKLISPKFRVLYVNVVTYGWNTFLAFYKNNYVNHSSDQVVSTNKEWPLFGSEGARHFPHVHFDGLPEEEMTVITERSKNIVKKMKM